LDKEWEFGSSDLPSDASIEFSVGVNPNLHILSVNNVTQGFTLAYTISVLDPLKKIDWVSIGGDFETGFTYTFTKTVYDAVDTLLGTLTCTKSGGSATNCSKDLNVDHKVLKIVDTVVMSGGTVQFASNEFLQSDVPAPAALGLLGLGLLGVAGFRSRRA